LQASYLEQVSRRKRWYTTAILYAMAAATSPALPGFSYAQAAKGLAPATSASQSQTESSPNTPGLLSTERKSCTPESEKLDPLHTTTVTGKDDEIPKDLASKQVSEEADAVSRAKPNPESNSSTTAHYTASSHSDSKQASESTSPNLVASTATLPREDESSFTPNGSSESWDKQSETSAMAERFTQITDSGKERSGDDDWVSVPAPKVEKELKAAPIPTVNIWQQRKEAQEAKAKASAALRSSAAAPAPTKPKAQTHPARNLETPAQDDETKRRPSGKLGDKVDGTLRKKQVDDTKTRDDGKCSLFRCNACC
jgi:la-related protein 1